MRRVGMRYRERRGGLGTVAQLLAKPVAGPHLGSPIVRSVGEKVAVEKATARIVKGQVLGAVQAAAVMEPMVQMVTSMTPARETAYYEVRAKATTTRMRTVMIMMERGALTLT